MLTAHDAFKIAELAKKNGNAAFKRTEEFIMASAQAGNTETLVYKTDIDLCWRRNLVSILFAIDQLRKRGYLVKETLSNGNECLLICWDRSKAEFYDTLE